MALLVIAARVAVRGLTARWGLLTLAMTIASALVLAQPGPAPRRHGMVVAVSPPGADVGREILLKGGNAVDAAVATGFAMAVTYPSAGNLGGGGFMVIHPPAGKGPPVVIDYREVAPLAASRTMYTPKDTWYTHKAVGVPGTVSGMFLAHKRFGKLPWKDVVAPAVKLAEDGFLIDRQLAGSLNWITTSFQVTPEMVRVLGKDNGKSPWQTGDRLVQKDLARTLKRISEQGADGFYKGETADLIAKEMKAGGGLIAKADLAGYSAKARKPIHGAYRGYDVYAPPPPSSGGICLVEMLNVLENFDLKKQGRYSAPTLHLMAETMRRAYCDRARFLGDQDFVKVPAHSDHQGIREKAGRDDRPQEGDAERGPGQGHPASRTRATTRRISASSTTTAWR